MHPLVVTLVWFALIAVAIVAVGLIFLHWFALGLTVGGGAENRFLLRVLAVAAVVAAVGVAGWYWWRRQQRKP